MKKGIFLIFFIVNFLFSNSLGEIREKGVLRIGVLDNQPPFSIYRDNSFEGFEIEFANELAKGIFGDSNGKIEFIPTNGNARITALESNKVDFVLATLTITDERAKKVDFSMPYFAVNIGILTKKADKIQKLSDLTGKTILVEDGTTGQKYFELKGYNTVVCPNSNACYSELKNNDSISGYANDNLIVLAYPVIDRQVESQILNLGNSDFLGIAVKKGNKELLDNINKQLINLSKSGFFRESFESTIDPFYKGSAEKKYFLLDDIYRIFG